MPRSVYDYIINGYGKGWDPKWYVFTVGFLSMDGKGCDGTYVTINGIKYNMGGGSINVTNVRSENQKPFQFDISLLGNDAYHSS